MEELTIFSDTTQFKYEGCVVIYAIKHYKNISLQEARDLYYTDKQKWQDWYEKKVVMPNKLIPLGKAIQWLRDSKCGDKILSDFEKAMLEE